MNMTSEEFAEGIQGQCPHKMTIRSFNHFKPDQTVWWLVPTIEWPAYKFGKYFFDSRAKSLPDGEQGCYCGFYVEKGITAKDAKPPDGMRMDISWKWNSFYKNFESNLQTLPQGYLVTVSVGYIADRKDSPSERDENYIKEKENFSFSSVVYEVLPEHKLKLRDVKLNSSNQKISEYFSRLGKKVNNPKKLAHLIGTLPELEWLWVDLYIGKVANANSGTFSFISAYQDIFAPLDNFLLS